MFKKFLIIFTFCMSLFSVVVFADEIQTTSIDIGGVEYNYYISYVHASGDKYTSFFVDKPVVNESNKSITAKDRWVVYNGLYPDIGSKVNSGNGGYFTNYSSIVQDNLSGGIIPPVVAPGITEAIQTITPHLSEQLKIYLPTGLILLSMVLGVSLVPRLVHLFL